VNRGTLRSATVRVGAATTARPDPQERHRSTGPLVRRVHVAACGIALCTQHRPRNPRRRPPRRRRRTLRHRTPPHRTLRRGSRYTRVRRSGHDRCAARSAGRPAGARPIQAAPHPPRVGRPGPDPSPSPEPKPVLDL